jgi:hypothetical protein
LKSENFVFLIAGGELDPSAVFAEPIDWHSILTIWPMFPQNILIIQRLGKCNVYGKFIGLVEIDIWITLFQKELAKPQNPNPKYILFLGNTKFKRLSFSV